MAIESTIREIILNRGYLTLDQLMENILSKHSKSYYKKDSILGEKGDFITAPEISQLFGEIIGLWAIEQWYKLNQPKKINLVELGPGRGLLMRDLLRVAKLVPEFYKALQIELLEINPYLRENQKNNLNIFSGSIKWLEDISDINNLPSIIIANEFFDALPIKQYIKFNRKWSEVVLTIDPENNSLKFDKREIEENIQKELIKNYPLTNEGAIVEQSIISLKMVEFISKHLMKYKGAGLIIDYGYNIPLNIRKSYQFNSTLQAIKNNKYHDLLKDLGSTDWSAHVDFDALKKVVEQNKFNDCQIFTQKDFLIKYGILLRSEKLKQNLPSSQGEIISRQVERLISSAQMGELFKVLFFSNY